MRNNLALLAAAIIFLAACHSRDKYAGWPHYKGSPESIHYSSLTQVDTSNVKNLTIAWEFHTGDADTVHHSQIQCNPIIIDGILYGTSPQMKLFAVDAATGKEKWSFNPFDSMTADKGLFFILNNCRGISYWQDDDDKRLYFTAGSYLHCVQAQTGKLVPSFGNNGKIDLHEGLDRQVTDLFVTATSPPVIYGDLLIIGSRVDEGPLAAPGHIRAYDVRTGKRRWIFHTIPFPGEEGYKTWDDSTAWQFIGGANAWSGLSLDEKRGIVFAGTGSASYDFYGGKRTGDNLFANCVLALDAATGKRIWHFQTVHHDIWDRDLSSPPILVTINRNGKKTDAVAVTTKTGYVYVFDRETGKPLFDVVEKAVPDTSPLTGEKLAHTQPYPLLPAPFMRQKFTEKDINPYLPDISYQDIKKRLSIYKNDHMFEPLSLQGTVFFPGLDGGGEWGGPSFDPATGILYVNSNEVPWVITAVDISQQQPTQENYEQAGKRLYQSNCMTCHGPERQGSGNFPSLLGVEQKYTLTAFHTLLQSGRRMMPAFKQLNEEEREAIASFVLGQQAMKSKPFRSKMADDHFKVPYSITGYNKFLSKEGYPAITPPWATLNAIDLNTGQYVWKKTFGHDTTVKNAKELTGAENYGASVVTAGGLLFIGATKDGKFRAYNKATGELLWQVDLPAPAFATPAVYEVNGKEYIVIACGGGKSRTPSGDSYVAFALPGQ